jgi:hypothetical protein
MWYSVFYCPYREGPASAKPRRNSGLRHERADRDTVSVGLGSFMPFRLVHDSIQCLGRDCLHEGQSHAPSPRHDQASLPIPSLSGGAENLTQRPHYAQTASRPVRKHGDGIAPAPRRNPQKRHRIDDSMLARRAARFRATCHKLRSMISS